MQRRAFLASSAGVLVLPTSVRIFAGNSTFKAVTEHVPDLWLRPRGIDVFNANTKQGGHYVFYDGTNYTSHYEALCSLLRDHHENKAVTLDVRLFNVMYATQTWFSLASGRSTHTVITSAYRTPNTNRLVGGALGGRHPLAAALDGYLAGLSLNSYAAMLQDLRSGGVGLYKNHCHWDVGRPPVFWQGRATE